MNKYSAQIRIRFLPDLLHPLVFGRLINCVQILFLEHQIALRHRGDAFWGEHSLISFQREELEKTGCNPDHPQPKRIDTSCCVLVLGRVIVDKTEPLFQHFHRYKNNTQSFLPNEKEDCVTSGNISWRTNRASAREASGSHDLHVWWRSDIVRRI